MPKKANAPSIPEWIKKGAAASFDLEGETETGVITEVKKDSAVVTLPNKQAYECEFEEITEAEAPDDEPEPEPKKKVKKGKTDPEEEKPKGKGKNISALWNSKEVADPIAAGFPLGNHEALVGGGEAATSEKGTSAFIEFVGVGSEEVEGKTMRQYFQLLNDEDEPLDGISYFKRAMVDLGVEEEELEIDAADTEELVEGINDLLKKLGKIEPWVSVKVVKGKNQFNNLYIQGLMEDQDQKPEMPAT